MSDLLGLKVAMGPTKYLGLPFLRGPKKKPICSTIVKKIESILAAWKMKTLSQLPSRKIPY